MKKLLIMALLFATQTNAQQITWQKYYNISTGINFCMSLLQLEDSGFIVASSWPQNPFIGRIFKTNKYGDTIQSVKTNTWCNIVKTHDQNFAYAGGSTLLGQGRLTKIDDSGE
jgi:hypothetical protein